MNTYSGSNPAVTTQGGSNGSTNIRFPYSIPPDSEIRLNLEISRLEKTAEQGEASSSHQQQPSETNKIFCELCTFPMTLRVRVEPCGHFLCYRCFENNPNDCKVPGCGFLVTGYTLDEVKY